MARSGDTGRAQRNEIFTNGHVASPTITGIWKDDGVIRGTAAAMSPERARGGPVDKRTEIWAFWCVLYEMLTGRVAFRGETVSDTIAAVLQREPDWSTLDAGVPALLCRVVASCLEKDAKLALDISSPHPEGMPPDIRVTTHIGFERIS